MIGYHLAVVTGLWARAHLRGGLLRRGEIIMISRLQTVVSLGVLVAIAGAASAAVYEKPLWLSGDNGAFSYSDQLIVDDFKLAGDATVSNASWYGNFVGTGDPFSGGESFQFTVRFFNDDGAGQASTSAFFTQNVAATLGTTGLSQEGDAIYSFFANFDGVSLNAETKYYFSVEEIDPNTAKPSFRWNSGIVDGDDDFINFGVLGQGWSQDFSRSAAAFALNVPAPASACAVLAGLLAVGRRRR